MKYINKKMYIDTFLPLKEREIDYQIKKRVRQVRQESKLGYIQGTVRETEKVEVKYQKLKIENVEWKWNEKREELKQKSDIKKHGFPKNQQGLIMESVLQ